MHHAEAGGQSVTDLTPTPRGLFPTYTSRKVRRRISPPAFMQVLFSRIGTPDHPIALPAICRTSPSRKWDR